MCREGKPQDTGMVILSGEKDEVEKGNGCVGDGVRERMMARGSDCFLRRSFMWARTE
jgi:hypothetical protein